MRLEARSRFFVSVSMEVASWGHDRRLREDVARQNLRKLNN